MPILHDFHMHTNHSTDSDASMESMIQASIAKGLKEICVTEHNDFDFPDLYDLPKDAFQLNVDSYLYEVIRLRERYQDQIKILFGIEIGLQKSCLRQNIVLSKSYDFDFIIASSHLTQKEDPYYPAFWDGKDAKRAVRTYFEEMLDNVKTYFGYDVYGHIDYIRRYIPDGLYDFTYADHADLIDEILKTIIYNEKGIECNTSGLNKSIKSTNPCKEILMRYKELGGEIITVGSDAHMPEAVAFGFDTTASLLKECGFSYYTTFEGRSPRFHKL